MDEREQLQDIANSELPELPEYEPLSPDERADVMAEAWRVMSDEEIQAYVARRTKREMIRLMLGDDPYATE